MDLKHGDWIVVGDGRKALFFTNEGDEKFPNLQTMNVLEQDNPPTHEQGTDRPGRSHASVGPGRSAVGQTDWHQLEEDRFAHTISDVLYKEAHKQAFDRVVIVAPPRTLGEIRKSLHPEVTQRVVAELDKDLTNMPPYEIEKALAAYD